MTLKNLFVGAAAGMAATVPMTLAMLVFYRFLPRSEQYPLPQGEIVEADHR